MRASSEPVDVPGYSDDDGAMTVDPSPLVGHYGRNETLVADILSGLVEAGYDVDSLDPVALSGADEFHLGGRLATLAVLDGLRAEPPTSVLDIGCGIGGPARTIATELGARTVGVDLTPSFVEAATELTERVGLGDRVSFQVGNALDLDVVDDAVDLVTLFHVGMNIADKVTLFAEAARVVRPGGRVLVYDIMRVGPGALTLPMPWASSPDHQHLAEPSEYLTALRSAGLEPREPVDHRAIVREALERSAASPPPVNLSHLMGPDFAEMFANLRSAVASGVVAPTEVMASKPG